MKSVGEVMAIGRSFEESLQKALRMLENGEVFLKRHDISDSELKEELKNPTDVRVYLVAEAMDRGFSPEEVHNLTQIDLWFLYKIQHMVDVKQELKKVSKDFSPELISYSKKAGFSDIQIAGCTGESIDQIRKFRWANKIHPVVKQIDTTAGEFPAQTNYLYLTYHGTENDINFDSTKNVMVLGGGAYRIGSSVEFDWCCVNAVMALKKKGFQTIMLNYNPETVSTDYDECDRLYFDEISLETILEINRKENVEGLIVSMGGQVPNNLALELDKNKLPIWGTKASNIDRAEDRHKFSALLDELGIDQPEWKELRSVEDAKKFASSIGYPVLIRPSYVLSGAAMSVAANDSQLEEFLTKATDLSTDHPVVVSKFILGAKEIEVDGISCEGSLITSAMSEHIEAAGVHSGDSSMVLPPQRVYPDVIRKIRLNVKRIIRELNIHGPFNIQFMVKDNFVKVIECNLRASRSFPFVCKVFNNNFIEKAISVMAGEKVEKDQRSVFDLEYVGVKAPQFSFTRLQGADPALGVEMMSTGEVACLGDDYSEALMKSLLSVGYKYPIKSILLSTGGIESKASFLSSARILEKLEIKMYATEGTAKFLNENGFDVETLAWPNSDAGKLTTDYIKEGKIDLVVNIPKNFRVEELTNGYYIRRVSADFSVPLITNMQMAQRFIEALLHESTNPRKIKSWCDYTQASI